MFQNDSLPGSEKLPSERSAEETKDGILRAALMSVALENDPRVDIVRRLPLREQPIPYEQALRILGIAPDKPRMESKSVGAGPPPSREEDLIIELSAPGTGAAGTAASPDSSEERARRLALTLIGKRPPEMRRTTRDRDLVLAFNSTRHLDGEEEESTLEFDSNTLVTTVNTTNYSPLDFDTIKQILDPQNWRRSPFWKASDRVVRGGRGFQLAPLPIGTPWPENEQAWCFEHVRWEWNLDSIAEFQNFLNISFTEFTPKEEDPSRKGIFLRFSLHSCQGSLLYARLSQRGVDVDNGFLKATPTLVTVNGDPTPVPGFKIETRKRIRFSEIEDKRISFQGMPGMAALISFLAPASVKLWMESLVQGISDEEMKRVGSLQTRRPQ